MPDEILTVVAKTIAAAQRGTRPHPDSDLIWKVLSKEERHEYLRTAEEAILAYHEAIANYRMGDHR